MIRKLVAAALAAAALTPVASNVGAAPTARPYVVLIRDGSDPAAVAARYDIIPSFVYTEAVVGLAAALTGQQVHQLEDDPTVISIEPDVTVAFTEPPSPPQAAQISADAVQRVGLLQSPTAHIDSVDERINMDVAVLDTGIQPDHPDLNVAGGVNCVPKWAKSWADDNDHGTEVAGLIGAIDNSIGVAGMAPGARLWSVKVLRSNGLGTLSTVLCGLDWVADHSDTIEVANLSLGGDISSPMTSCLDTDDLEHKALCEVVDAGVTVVVAAGNESSDTANKHPARYPEVITVSALADNDGTPGGIGQDPWCNRKEVPRDDHFASFSNYGEAVDIAAPGVCVTTTRRGSDYISGISGTSFSSPIVAGAAALYISTHPDATPAEVRQALIDRAEPGPIPGDPDTYPEGVLNVRGL